MYIYICIHTCNGVHGAAADDEPDLSKSSTSSYIDSL